MQINECSYCGLLAITENGICYNCQKALGQNLPEQEMKPENVSEISFAPTITETFSEPFEGETYADEFQSEFGEETFPPPPQAAEDVWQKCSVCNISVVQNGGVCHRCSSYRSYNAAPKAKKSPFGKIFAAFLLLGVAGIGFYYFYWIDSVYGISYRFGSATGISDNIVYDSFSANGTAKIGLAGVSGWTINSQTEQSFSFSMDFKKPGKIVVDLYRYSLVNGVNTKQSILKQGFNGTSGWKLTQPPNQKATLEDAGDSFGSRDLGSGENDNISIVTLSDTDLREKSAVIKYYDDNIKTFNVNGVSVVSNSKTYLLVKKKLEDGTTDSTLLVFDKDSGFLIGMSKTETKDGKPVAIKIALDEYSRFRFRENGYFGESGKTILIPTVWKLKFDDDAPATFNSSVSLPSLVFSLKIDSVIPDKTIDDAIFERPVLNNWILRE